MKRNWINYHLFIMNLKYAVLILKILGTSRIYFLEQLITFKDSISLTEIG